MCASIYVSFLGTFVVNSLPTLVLFDLGASRSFVSQSFPRSFNMPLQKLECLLRVSITKKQKVFLSSIFHDYIFEIFGVPYPIDLIPIPIRDVCVIMGMDWSRRF